MHCPVCHIPIHAWCAHNIGMYRVYYNSDGTMSIVFRYNHPNIGIAGVISKHIAFRDEEHIERMLLLI